MTTWLESILDPTFERWAALEDEYEQFLGRYSHEQVVAMPEPEYIVWQAEYRRLYDALINAQLLAYSVSRGAMAQ